MESYYLDWANLLLRWVHVITAVAWIGSSFYFIALDLGLHRDRNLASGADGEEWQVHGGGFYHIQKYLVAPENMPEHPRPHPFDLLFHSRLRHQRLMSISTCAYAKEEQHQLRPKTKQLLEQATFHFICRSRFVFLNVLQHGFEFFANILYNLFRVERHGALLCYRRMFLVVHPIYTSESPVVQLILNTPI